LGGCQKGNGQDEEKEKCGWGQRGLRMGRMRANIRRTRVVDDKNKSCRKGERGLQMKRTTTADEEGSAGGFPEGYGR